MVSTRFLSRRDHRHRENDLLLFLDEVEEGCEFTEGTARMESFGNDSVRVR